MSFGGLGSFGALGSAALSPAAIAALGAAGGAAIVALYLLRLRRRRVVVSFAPLWLGVAGDARAARRRRRLRHWLSLALALALYGALLTGAADPRGAAVDRAGRSVVLLVDRSASMSATDEPGTRLAAAKRRAQALAAGLGSADRALVAAFAADVTAETGFETDPRRLARGIEAISASDESGDLPRALAFAAAVLRGRPRPTIVLVSDGGFSADARRAAPVDPDGRAIDVRYAPVGRRGDNVGILAFAARRLPADPGAVETALIVQSFRPRPSTATVEIASGGAVVETLALTLAPGERRRALLSNLFPPEARLEARLVGGDDLPLDDRATATVPPLARRRVLRVGGADLYLDGALLGLGRAVRVDRLPAAEADRALARAADYDLVIFDGVTPHAPPSSGRYLYLDPQGPGSPFERRGSVRDPVIDPASLRREHPLLRQVDLTDVNIAEAGRLALAPGDIALAASFGVPLIAARERPGLRLAALAFDPRRSDLPMRPAFPLLVSNVLAWSARADDPAIRGAASGGTAGTSREARESDLAPAAALTLGGAALAAPDPPAHRPHLPAGILALVVAAALLLVEWLSYHRRWTT
ncbi:MAG TPA: VWA domain-containing protein [Polyangia bacterium]|nr:VWA domain-containing protein [Polyangia bacterium]